MRVDLESCSYKDFCPEVLQAHMFSATNWLVMRAEQDANMQGIDLAISLVGGQVRLAESLGVRQQTVSYWRKAGVPVEHCAAIERLTGGRVTRRDLRPDDWARIWPELQELAHG